MANIDIRTLAILALLASVRCAQFGDRLAPRIPAAYAPRAAPAALQYEDAEYEEITYDEDVAEEVTAPDEDSSFEIETKPRHPARTEAHRLEMSTEYFVVPERTTSTPFPQLASKVITDVTTPAPNISTVLSVIVVQGALRAESWAVPILAIACAFMIALSAFEAFVVWGARHTSPSRRHLLLGQTLLFGLFSCAGTAALFAASPTPFTCGAVRFGTGASYVVVFASLLVKCVFLLSLNGGVYLPAAYQGLLLFFAVMIQVAIGAQWLGGSPPRVEFASGRCGASLSDLLLSLCYAAFLIAIVCGVALRSRGIRDNYREATHIAGAGGASAAVWVCWMAAALGAPERYRDACIAAGLLATCAVVFVIMFAPKGRRLAALGREGRWDTDREEGLSSLGAAGSGYSPSFFHFKPVKYGMVSAAAPLPPPPPQDRKELPAQPADPYVPLAFTSPPHMHARPVYPPPHYIPHPLLHYHYNYSPYHFLLPPGLMVRPEDGNMYTTVEPTFSSNPNVYFQRSEPVHVGMMY